MPKTQLNHVSTFCHRGMRRLLLVAAALGLTMCGEPELKATSKVVYLQQIPVVLGKQKVYPIPIYVKGGPAAGAGTYGPFSLTGYGTGVYVTLSCDPNKASTCLIPALTWQHLAAVENQSAGSFRWGSDTDFLSLGTGSTGGDYLLTFNFTGIAVPNPSDLVLVVAALKDGSNVTVSGTDSSLKAVTLANTNGGEYSITDPAWLYCSPTCTSTAPTIFKPGTLNFSSGYNWNSKFDDRNTGWDLYQPKSPALRILNLAVHQVSGDGLGFTLGYSLCSSLVGISPQFGPAVAGPDKLYDISTQTGTATNPRQIRGEGNLGMAFSPNLPGGTLNGLSGNGYLLTVDPITGVPTKVPGPPVSTSGAVALAADPTSGTLYGIDGWGLVFQASGLQGQQPLGNYPVDTSFGSRPFSDIYAMAFDALVDLFVVNNSSQKLIRVDKTTGKPVSSVSLTGSKTLTGFAGLAIDPFSGTAYYADRSLYTLNLTTGKLTLVGGSSEPGQSGMSGLTFTVGACPAVSNVTPVASGM